MKRLFLMSLFIGIALLYFGCSENSPIISESSQIGEVTNTLAKKPLPTLTGEMALNFTLTPPYFWNGTVTFPTETGTETYGLRYMSVGDPPPPPPRAFVFAERFEIYTLGNPNDLLLEGPNAGVVPCGNDMFVANGKVEFAKANGPFEMWRGRNVHESGIITWVIPCILPAGAPTGTFRIN